MTDKQLIETLRNIKEYCGSFVGCYGCKFKSNTLYEAKICQIRQLGMALKETTPNSWDMEKIERIINE